MLRLIKLCFLLLGTSAKGDKISASPSAPLKSDALGKAGDARIEEETQTGANQYRITLGTYECCKYIEVWSCKMHY